ncbi:thiamine pyrophosphate-dependent dehydrogenase E1 component subunit alpha [Kordiimonas laminariae]|uniref:thiamine pyrophosphate-dependent dehydrogenase E1 component subunit alpha n=1 Tax=Kordiimonas laminariae TaxID=2917717 RepID=UPI001FF181A2|nr:thiamine pyrophosphate-dependent dehydrogenase E1 component subunit alpha [Kordiimonas laminariae]MCK0070344.1 thiamine pyrophosphate-dependent dehydrogenase E1 component subunit alpha [Kordiimonas laminariae]
MQNKLAQVFKKSVEIRVFETMIASLADEGKVPGLVHLCNGAETLQSAVCLALNSTTDSVTGSHRSHGLALAMGADPYKVASEILGKADGLSAGMGGTQHLLAPEVGFLSSNGIVGGQVPMASGAALSAKVLKTGGIGVTFFGDGAANQGAVLETMNLAVALQLPMLFVLENNGFGQSTSAEFASGGVSLLKRAEGFGLQTYALDGADAKDCIEKVETVVTSIKAGEGPVFIEASVPRLAGHYHGETAAYLSDCGGQTDPLKILNDHIGDISEGIWRETEALMVDVMKRASAAPVPSQDLLRKFHTEMGGQA